MISLPYYICEGIASNERSECDMKKHRVTGKDKTSMHLLLSYLLVILAPAVAIVIIYITMQGALLDIQKEKSQNLSKEAVLTFNG